MRCGFGSRRCAACVEGMTTLDRLLSEPDRSVVTAVGWVHVTCSICRRETEWSLTKRTAYDFAGVMECGVCSRPFTIVCTLGCGHTVCQHCFIHARSDIRRRELQASGGQQQVVSDEAEAMAQRRQARSTRGENFRRCMGF